MNAMFDCQVHIWNSADDAEILNPTGTLRHNLWVTDGWANTQVIFDLYRHRVTTTYGAARDKVDRLNEIFRNHGLGLYATSSCQ